MDPDSKRVWAVQLPRGWMYNILSDVSYGHQIQKESKDKEGSLRFAALHAAVSAGLHPFLCASLNSMHFHGTFISRMFVSAPAAEHCSLC